MAKKRENFTLEEKISIQLQNHSNKTGQSKSFIVNELLEGFFDNKSPLKQDNSCFSDVISYIEERGVEDLVEKEGKKLLNRI